MDYQEVKKAGSAYKNTVAFSIIKEIQQRCNFSISQIASYSNIPIRTLYRVCERQVYKLHPITFQKLLGIYCLFCFVIPKNLPIGIKQKFFPATRHDPALAFK